MMDENQQPSVQQKLERLSHSIRMEGGEVKAESYIRLGQVSHLLLQQLIQILDLQHCVPQNERLQKHGIKNFWRLPVNLVFFPCKT